MKTVGAGASMQVNLMTGSIGRFRCQIRFFLLSSFLILVLALPASAQYTLLDDDVVVTDGIIESCSYDFEIKDIIIPDTLDGQAVREFTGKYASGLFGKKGILSIKLPSTIQIIGTRVFLQNDLTSIDFSGCKELKSIDNWAFKDNPIESLDLSSCNALIYIGGYAFAGNGSMASFTLPRHSEFDTYGWRDNEENQYMSDDEVSDFSTYYFVPAPYTLTDDDVELIDGIIQSCSYDFTLKVLIIPDTLEGQEVKGIADGAVAGKEYCVGVFSEKGIQEVVFPSTLERIGDCAFAENNLHRIDLTGCPDLTVIGNYAFWYNYDLVSVDLSGCSALKEIKSYVFYDNYITDLSLSGCSALEIIGYMAFLGNAIASLDLSDCSSLRMIESHAFNGNPLTEVNFSGSTALEEIRSGAFKSCDLITLDLSSCSALAVIEPYAFTNNPLSSINLNGCISLKTIGASAFHTNDLENVKLQGCPVLSEIGSAAFFRNRISMIDFSGCDNLRSIGNFAFSENELDSIDLTPCSALEEIGTNAFAENLSLDSFVLPVNIAYEYMGWRDKLGDAHMGGEVVNDLSSNYYVPIPYTLTADDFSNGSTSSFCTYDFEYTDVIIPDTLGGDTVKYIGVPGAGNGIFYNKPVTSVILPSTLEIIGRYAFRKNSSLRSLDFSNCRNLKAIESSAIVENTIDQLDLSACSSLNKIGDYAFRENAISSIDLTACTSLTTIGRGAFENNFLSGFVLPVNTEYSSFGWKDPNGNVYAGGDSVLDHSLFYYVPAPYTLTDADVEMSDGFIETCSYDFHLREIIVPDTLDGQAVYGIGGLGWGERMVLGKNGIVSIKLPSTAESIGETAFYDNDLSMIDLKNCTRLVSIGENAFILNPMQSFVLPVPDIPGHQFNHWMDKEGNVYEGGSTTNNLYTSYTADLTTLYTVTFTVTDGTHPVEDAAVSLGGYETVISDAEGVASIKDILPEDDIGYTVKATGYEDVTATLSVADSDMKEQVTMVALTGIWDLQENRIRLYPNPTNNLLTIETDNSGQYSFEITSLNGRLLYSERMDRTSHQLDMSLFKKGIYFITVRSEDFVTTAMILKQ